MLRRGRKQAQQFLAHRPVSGTSYDLDTRAADHGSWESELQGAVYRVQTGITGWMRWLEVSPCRIFGVRRIGHA